MLEYQNTKTFLLSKEAFVVSKIKDSVPWTHAVSELDGEPISGSFYEKELQKTNKKKTQNIKGN